MPIEMIILGNALTTFLRHRRCLVAKYNKTAIETLLGLEEFYIGNCDPAKKNVFGGLCLLFSLLLAQLSELLPLVSVVETPHVAVHLLFHSRIEASIRLASTAQAFWHPSFHMRPDFVKRLSANTTHVCQDNACHHHARPPSPTPQTIRA